MTPHTLPHGQEKAVTYKKNTILALPLLKKMASYHHDIPVMGKI